MKAFLLVPNLRRAIFGLFLVFVAPDPASARRACSIGAPPFNSFTTSFAGQSIDGVLAGIASNGDVVSSLAGDVVVIAGGYGSRTDDVHPDRCRLGGTRFSETPQSDDWTAPVACDVLRCRGRKGRTDVRTPSSSRLAGKARPGNASHVDAAWRRNLRERNLNRLHAPV